MRHGRLLPLLLIVLGSCAGDSAATSQPTGTPTPLPGLTTTALTTVPSSTTTESEGRDDQSREVLCGGDRFSPVFLDGPQYERQEFFETPVGAFLKEFFTSGPGAGTSFMFVEAEGFSLVSSSLVLGYVGNLPTSSYRLEEDRIVGWGTCSLRWVKGELRAHPWGVGPGLPGDAIEIPISVAGGGCTTNTGAEVVTEVADIDVTETVETVEITAWVRQLPWEGLCADVGLQHDVSVRLMSPLGHRVLLDAGAIPNVEILP